VARNARGGSGQSVGVVSGRVFMEGRRLRVGGKRVPGEGCFRAENPRSPKGDKNRRKKTGASRPARINCGKIFAGRSSQGFAKGFSAALYDAINEAYSTIGKNNKYFL
uniref:hypothetical protein n=1 Tax=Alistipes shahii TaxID=328814 RepID=UPI003FF0A98A